MKPEVSVIIPMFKVAPFIERCAESLMKQTLVNVEFIFVDDASPDNCVELLKSVLSRYPERNTAIIAHERNLGLPSARNTGFEASSGEYIFHCDGDDWVEENMLEKMLSAARETDADYIWCDFFISFDSSERPMRARNYKTPEELLHKGYICGDMKYNVWNKLVRRDLYAAGCISFPEGHPMGEDMTMIRLAACAEKVAYVPECLYHYVKTNSAAYTNAFSDRNLADIRYNTDCTLDFLTVRGLSEEDAAIFKLNVKLPMLISDDNSRYQIWKEWYPEANKYIFRNTELPLRTKILQWCAAHDLWVLVKAYYVFVFKFVYGIIYR